MNWLGMSIWYIDYPLTMSTILEINLYKHTCIHIRYVEIAAKLARTTVALTRFGIFNIVSLYLYKISSLKTEAPNFLTEYDIFQGCIE